MRLWLVRSEDVEKVVRWLRVRTPHFNVDWKDFNPLIAVKVFSPLGFGLLAWLRLQNIPFLYTHHSGRDNKLKKPKEEKPRMEKWR